MTIVENSPAWPEINPSPCDILFSLETLFDIGPVDGAVLHNKESVARIENLV